MKNFKWTLVFGGVVAALVAFAVFDYNRGEDKKKKDEELATLVRYPEEDIHRIELVNHEAHTVLEKKEGKWFVTEPVHDLAETTSVLSLLKSLSDEKSRETVAEGEGIDLKIYGLDQPSHRLVLKAGGDRTEEVKIGSIKAYDASLYAQVDSEKKISLVTSTWTDHLAKPAREFRNKRLYRNETEKKLADEYDTIEVALGAPYGNTTYQVVKLKEGGWQMKGVASPAPLSEDAVVALGEQVKNLRAVDFIEADKNAPGVLAKHGLQKPAITVRLKRGTETPFELKVAAGKGTEANVMAVSSDLKDVVSVFKTAAETVAKKPEALFDKKDPFKFPLNDVAWIVARTGGPNSRAVEFRKNGDKWEGGLHGTPDTAKLNELVSKLAALEAARFLEPKMGKVSLGKSESTIQFKKASGELVFEMAWGEPAVTVKADASGPAEKVDLKNPGALEITYHRTRTSRSNRLVGISPGAVQGLGLDEILAPPKAEPQASPAPLGTPH